MNLGILLPAGDSLLGMEKSGQLIRFRKYYIEEYAKHFEDVYIYSYLSEQPANFPKNVHLIPNKYNLHRYLYGFLLPFLNLGTIRNCDVFRAFHLSGTVPAILIKMLFRKPFVFNYAYDYIKFAQIDNKLLARILFKVIYPLTVRFADKIFAANKNILSSLPVKKTVYLPNGVDINIYKHSSIKKEENGDLNILSVGRLEKQKNFNILIKALNGLPVKLTIVGNGSLKQELLNLAKKEKVKLEIIEKIENNKMPRVYNQADIFVLPSLIEGHPKVLLEAMSCGVPVIGTNVDGINEIIIDNKNGLLCSADRENLRSKIQYLLNNPKVRNSLARASRMSIVTAFNLYNILAIEINALKKVLA